MPELRCSIYIAASLDGFIARADGGIDWLSIVQREGEDYGYARFFGSVDTLVMGRKTYETALGFPSWPYDGKRCIVLTRSVLVPRHGEETYAGDLAVLVEKLAAEGARRVYVDGGAVISQFLASDLITDVTVSVIPVLLGEGIRLTQTIGHDVRLELVESRPFASGLVQLEYRSFRREARDQER